MSYLFASPWAARRAGRGAGGATGGPWAHVLSHVHAVVQHILLDPRRELLGPRLGLQRLLQTAPATAAAVGQAPMGGQVDWGSDGTDICYHGFNRQK